MINKFAAGLGLAMLVGGATMAAAQTSTATSTPTAPAPKPAKPKRICRSDVAVGTILPTSICHTKEEWAAIDGRNQANAGRALEQRPAGLSGSTPPG